MGPVLAENVIRPEIYRSTPITRKDYHPERWVFERMCVFGQHSRPEAGQHFASALDWTSRHQRFMELMVALAGVALLLADDEEVERAIELYALASRHPFVANSRWFEEVIGRHIAAVAGTLPAERVAILEERSRTRDLESTTAELLVELHR